MIEIIVNGIPLTLYSDTTLNVELNNALFSSPDIDGDITYSFDLPVSGNERALEFAHLPERAQRTYGCKMTLCGVISFNGKISVQKADSNRMTAAIVLSPYPEGFGKRSLADNKDDEIIVSRTKTGHKEAWKEFIKNSLSNPDVKFAPFLNEEGYGSENEDFGSWKGYVREKVVNAVLFDQWNNIINSVNHPFSKVFPERFWLNNEDDESYMERNQLALCPQIRIAKVMEIWCRNAGFQFIDHIGSDLSNTFLQSQLSLDATYAQYLDSGSQLVIHTTASILQDHAYYYCNSFWENGVSQDQYVHNGGVWLPTTGWWTLQLNASLQMPENYWGFLEDKWSKWVMLAGAFLAGGGSIPIGGVDITALIVALTGSHHYDFTNEKIHFCIYKGTHTVTEIDNGTDVLYHHEFPAATAPAIDFCTDFEVPSGFTDEKLKFIFYCKKERKNKDPQYYAISRANLDIKLHQRGIREVQGGLNIWKKSFNIPECCPDITNANFLKTCLDTFGLCYYVSSKNKEVEFVPFSDIQNAHSLDLTKYELVRETDVTSADSKARRFRLKPLKDEDYDKQLRIPDTDSELPEVIDNIDHYILSKETNTLYKAETVECEEEAWMAQWIEHSGNPDSIVIDGDDNSGSQSEPAVAIPHQRVLDGRKPNGEKEQMQVANFTIHSSMYNRNEKPTELILTQYRGYKEYDYEIESVRYYRAFDNDSQTWDLITEDELNQHRDDYGEAIFDHTDMTTKSAGRDLMIPVCDNLFALKAKGFNSLGEKYVKPVMEILNHRNITYKFRIPLALIPEVDNLLRPQHRDPINQTRFLMVRNVKSVPKRIQFQIENDDSSGFVLCQIEAVRLSV